MGVRVLEQTGGDGPRLLLLYAGGTIGMGAGPDGALVPLDAAQLLENLPLRHLPFGITMASVDEPIDSSAVRVDDWHLLADAIAEHAPDHAGVVVLHGTDTMAFTASALSFLLAGVDRPVVFTGAQRPVTQLRSDGRQNVVTALEIAAGPLLGGPLVPEVAIVFDDVLLRGNRAVKVHADSFRGFASPNHPPLATIGVSIDHAEHLIRAPSPGPMRRVGAASEAVAALRLHPALQPHDVSSVLARPGLRGLVVEAYGAGNGPPVPWLLEPLAAAVDEGVTVVIVTQCHHGAVLHGLYATGSRLLDTGAVPGGDMTFEAALTKLMVLVERHEPAEVRRLVQEDLAGELTP